jgi:two-component system response regulator FlrC
MSSIHTAQQVLWLDPIQPLDAPEHAQLTAAGLSVRCISTLDELQSALSHGQIAALVLRHDTTLDLLQSCQNIMLRAGCAVPMVCRVDRRHLELAVQAMRQGAAHVLATDDWSAASWQMAHQAIQALRLSSSAASMVARMAPPSEVVAQAAPQKSVVYVDPVSRHLLALAQRVAQANVTALIEGPTGAGKEILARVLHESSKRARGPFVGLNCAALPEHLIDDMLFGHEKGAFTGAQKDFKGLFEQAQGGTLFLDEIGEMPLHLQSKLLRVLQERLLTRWVLSAKWPLMCASLQPPTKICAWPLPSASSAKICISASAHSNCACRHCANAKATSCLWWPACCCATHPMHKSSL